MAAVAVVAAFIALSQAANLSWKVGPWRNAGASLTYDEVAHIPAGYYYLTTGRYDLNPEHPPLVKDIAGLALLSLPVNSQHLSAAEQANANTEWTYGANLLFHSKVSVNTIVHRARLAVTLLNAILLFIFYLVLRMLVSRRAALLALLLVSLNPFMLSNGGLVTTDVPSALLMAIALMWSVVTLRDLWSDRPWVRDAIVLGIWSGLAMLAKFSGIITLPAIILIYLAYLAVKRAERARIYRVVGAIAVASAAAIVMVLALYIPQTHNMSHQDVVTQLEFHLPPAAPAIERKAFVHLADLPKIGKAVGQYINGVLLVQSRMDTGDNEIYFAGTVYGAQGSGWTYFPVMYLAKMPLAYTGLALLVALSVGALWWRHRRLEMPKFLTFAVCGFCAIYGAFALTSTLQIGVRYVAVIIVLVPALTAFLADFLLQRSQRPKWLKPTVYSLVALAILPVLWSFPYYLSYYNLAAGGTSGGYRLADDSNYDWGQDLSRLDQWAKSHHVKHLYVYGLLNSYIPLSDYVKTDMTELSTADPSSLPAGSLLAVSTTMYEFANGHGTGRPPVFPATSQAIARPAPSWFVFKISK